MTAQDHPPTSGDRALRDELLRDMSGGEEISLSHIDSIVAYDHSAEPLPWRQWRVFGTIESLLVDGLIVIGDTPYADMPVESWQLSTEDALARLRERYVTHYLDEVKWGWCTWFELTPDGEEAAKNL